MIEFKHVSKQYTNGFQALDDISFNLAKGDMSFLLGHSGAGKSTLLKLITRIERPSRGQIIIDEQNLQTLKSSRVPYLRREIGVIFQDHKLLMDRPVFDNVALPLIVGGMSYNETKKRVRAALGKVGLADKEKALPLTLSGGEQQRVGIARAVINRPSILLADEPTGNLDQDLSAEIIDIFSDFNQVGVTVLIATHDLQQVQRMNKRTIHLDHGVIVPSDSNNKPALGDDEVVLT